jgi:predicted RNase H-like HicB family nuclease
MVRNNQHITVEQLRYPFRVAPEAGGWTVWFPDLPGCMGFTERLEDIGKEAETVLGLWIESEVEQRHPIPEPTDDGVEETWTIESYMVDELPEPEFLTAKDVAVTLGVSERRVHQLATTREVGRIVGGARIFLPSEVESLRPGPVGRPPKSRGGRTLQAHSTN